MTRVALLRLALYYSVVPLLLAHKPIACKDKKESRGVITSRGRTRVTLLRLALCYSVVPLRSAHKPIPYEDSKRMGQSNQINQIKSNQVCRFVGFLQLCLTHRITHRINTKLHSKYDDTKFYLIAILT